MRIRLWTIVMLAAAALLSPAANAGAQFPRTLDIAPAIAGACSVLIRLPDSKAVIATLTVDDGAVRLTKVPLKKMTRVNDFEVVVPLLGPLQQGDRLAVTLRDPAMPATTVVGPGVSGDVSCKTEKHAPDDREVFALDGFYGLAIDNFAPNSITGYPASAASTRSRRTFGVIGQYRVFGNPGDDRQLWLAGATLNGLRTADIDCTDAEQSSLCTNGKADTTVTVPKDLQGASVQVLEHATTLEAHIGLRYEFLTLQKQSPTPAKVFGFYNYGFIDIVNPVVSCAQSTAVTGATTTTVDSACLVTVSQGGQTQSVSSQVGGPPTAFSAHYFGVGALIPAGPFHDSGVTWGLAKEDIYGTSRGWSRLKLNALAVFDIMPQWGDFNAGKWLGFGSWRFFIALDVDRDTHGHGPDTIESYVGVAFDLAKAFHL